jgi:hypothetical protein
MPSIVELVRAVRDVRAIIYTNDNLVFRQRGGDYLARAAGMMATGRTTRTLGPILGGVSGLCRREYPKLSEVQTRNERRKQ